MNVVIIGNVCVDKNTVEKTSYKSAGSPAMFMTRIFSQIPGVETTIVSHYGKDFIKYIEDKKIYPLNPKFEETLLYNNINPGKGRRVQKAFNRDNSPPVDLEPELKAILHDADILFIAPLLPNFDVEKISLFVKEVNPKCLKILLPQGYFREFDKSNKVIFREFKEAGEVISYFDFVILSDEDYPDIEAVAKLWVKDNDTGIIITKGEQGAMLITRNTALDVSTKPVIDVVDSTGSGDVFGASFAYNYYETKDRRASIQFANKVAGLCLGFAPVDIKIDYRSLRI